MTKKTIIILLVILAVFIAILTFVFRSNKSFQELRTGETSELSIE